MKKEKNVNNILEELLEIWKKQNIFSEREISEIIANMSDIFDYTNKMNTYIKEQIYKGSKARDYDKMIEGLVEYSIRGEWLWTYYRRMHRYINSACKKLEKELDKNINNKHSTKIA